MQSGHTLAFDLVPTQSGALSLRSRAEGETFHPGLGPIGEAEHLHVGAQRLAERARAHVGDTFLVWDVGLGAAANAVAALDALRATGRRVELHSFERDCGAAEFALTHADALGYVTPYRAELRELLDRAEVQVGNVLWRLHRGDFSRSENWAAAPVPQAVLYDPYSPKTNAPLWTLEHFAALRQFFGEDAKCTLSSYSRSSAVRVSLLLAGFFVGPGPESGDKDETTLAATAPELLPRLLDERWLLRVKRSTASAPLRAEGLAGPISEEDWMTLNEHPQFGRERFR